MIVLLTIKSTLNKFDIYAALLCAVLFYCEAAICQKGKVIYTNDASISSHFQKIKQKNKIEYLKYKKLAEYEMDLMKKIEYELIFNEQESIFKVIEKKNVDEEINMIYKSEGIFYKNTDENICFIKKRFSNYSIDLMQIKWEIQEDTKSILGYKCKKAIGYKTDKKNNTFLEDRAEAWFCPAIKHSYGPLGFSNLPGIILQLDYKSYHLLAKEIIFSDKIKLSKPNFNSKKISEIQFSKIMKDKFN